MISERITGNSDSDNGTEHTQMLPSVIAPSVQTRDWRLFNVVLLGVTFLFVFTAFQTCSMVEVCDIQLLYCYFVLISLYKILRYYEIAITYIAYIADISC